MADWQDMGDGYVRNPAGREVPREMVPPTDRIMPPQGAAPVAAPPPVAGAPAPAAPGAPMAPLTAASTLAKLDDPRVAAVRGQPQLPIAQQSTTTQSAVPMSTLKPAMDRRMARAETQGQAAIALGEEKSRIGEQQAMTASTAAYGQMQQSQAEADMHAQNAEIARQSELAVAMQKDPELEAGRYISNMTTGQSIGTVILAAIEGAFRGMTGQAGQSGVANILEKRIEQDIMAQKEQIQSGRIRKGNTLSALRNMGMSEEAAEKGARALAYAKAEQLTQSELARIGAGIHRAEGQALAEQLKVTAEQANDDWMLSIGTPRSSTTTVRQAPGGGDGDSFSKMLSTRKSYEEAGATPEQLAQFDKMNGLTGAGMAPAGESEVARARREKGEARTDVEKTAKGAIETIDELGAQLGLARDPDGKGFRENPADKSVMSKKTGEDFASGFSFGIADNPIEASTGAAVEAFGRLQSQGVISPKEEERFRDMIAGAKTDAQRAIALNAIRPIIEAKLNVRDRQSGSPEASGFKKVPK